MPPILHLNICHKRYTYVLFHFHTCFKPQLSRERERERERDREKAIWVESVYILNIRMEEMMSVSFTSLGLLPELPILLLILCP
jgi:hypothetical protein